MLVLLISMALLTELGDPGKKANPHCVRLLDALERSRTLNRAQVEYLQTSSDLLSELRGFLHLPTGMDAKPLVQYAMGMLAEDATAEEVKDGIAILDWVASHPKTPAELRRSAIGHLVSVAISPRYGAERKTAIEALFDFVRSNQEISSAELVQLWIVRPPAKDAFNSGGREITLRQLEFLVELFESHGRDSITDLDRIDVLTFARELIREASLYPSGYSIDAIQSSHPVAKLLEIMNQEFNRSLDIDGRAPMDVEADRFLRAQIHMTRAMLEVQRAVLELLESPTPEDSSKPAGPPSGEFGIEWERSQKLLSELNRLRSLIQSVIAQTRITRDPIQRELIFGLVEMGQEIIDKIDARLENVGTEVEKSEIETVRKTIKTLLSNSSQPRLHGPQSTAPNFDVRIEAGDAILAALGQMTIRVVPTQKVILASMLGALLDYQARRANDILLELTYSNSRENRSNPLYFSGSEIKMLHDLARLMDFADRVRAIDPEIMEFNRANRYALGTPYFAIDRISLEAGVGTIEALARSQLGPWIQLVRGLSLNEANSLLSNITVDATTQIPDLPRTVRSLTVEERLGLVRAASTP